MVLAMVSKAVTLQSLTYLIIYNAVFILPMVIITLAVYFGYATVESIGDAREKYIRRIHLVSGILLFCLFLIMLNEWLGFF
jgi:cytochrome c biogenesis protein CcdA